MNLKHNPSSSSDDESVEEKPKKKRKRAMSNVSIVSTRSETERKDVARRAALDKKVNDALNNGYVAPKFKRIDEDNY